MAINYNLDDGDDDDDDDDDEDKVDATLPLGPDSSQNNGTAPSAPSESPLSPQTEIEGDSMAATTETKKRSKFRAPKSKGERNAYAFLETHKKSFLRLRADNDDLEECLELEWDNFCSECEGRLAEDRNLTNAFRMLRGVFETLAW